jgi:DNA uptake protein ComE-like DNA-binding protein
MFTNARFVGAGLVSVALVLSIAGAAWGQVGKSLGLKDFNTMPESELRALPHMTDATARAVLAARPFASPETPHQLLLQVGGLSLEQAGEIYKQAFVHINLNTATPQEIMLIPGAGKKMAREFAEYRPWKTWAQFEKEIGKYVGKDEVARLAQYCFIPIPLNTASDEDLQSIPGVGSRMLRELKEYRPYKSMEQFRRDIGKYVDERELSRLERYLTIDG